MKTARKLENVTRRFYRSEQRVCPVCQRRLRRAVTLSERTVVTLHEAVKVIHAGYRCPDAACSAHRCTYRSSTADALALPGFTFGLDVVLLIGRLRLGEHHTLDETHRQVLSQLAPLGVSISRREVLYLCDAYCTLLRAGTDAKEDWGWREQVEQNGGIIVSMDGIQPDKGNETIYLVRDALTGRVLSAANVTFSGIAVLKGILAPVTQLGVPVLGTISDAQDPLLKALEQTWPDVPHQVCQFHALRDASRPAFEQDRKIKTQMRKYLHPRLKDVREEIRRELPKAEAQAAEQLSILDDYALGMQAALHFDGTLPFDYPGVAAVQAFSEVKSSLEELEKKGGHEAGSVARS
jgi:hypothetical protein